MVETIGLYRHKFTEKEEFSKSLCVCVCVCVCVCLPLPSNQSLYRLIVPATAWMGGGDHEVPKGVMGKQMSYMSSIGVHSSMQLNDMHPQLR